MGVRVGGIVEEKYEVRTKPKQDRFKWELHQVFLFDTLALMEGSLSYCSPKTKIFKFEKVDLRLRSKFVLDMCNLSLSQSVLCSTMKHLLSMNEPSCEQDL